MKSHAFHMLYAGTQSVPEIRAQVGQSRTLEEIAAACAQLKARREADASIPQLGWYNRYRKPINVEPSARSKDKKDNAESGAAAGGCIDGCAESANDKEKSDGKRKAEGGDAAPEMEK